MFKAALTHKQRLYFMHLLSARTAIYRTFLQLLQTAPWLQENVFTAPQGEGKAQGDGACVLGLTMQQRCETCPEMSGGLDTWQAATCSWTWLHWPQHGTAPLEEPQPKEGLMWFYPRTKPPDLHITDKNILKRLVKQVGFFSWGISHKK